MSHSIQQYPIWGSCTCGEKENNWIKSSQLDEKNKRCSSTGHGVRSIRVQMNPWTLDGKCIDLELKHYTGNVLRANDYIFPI